MIRKTSRRVTPVSGRTVYPGGLMTVEACLHELGLGRDSLRIARANGMVTPIEIGKRTYYLSSELIAWVQSQRTHQTAST